jgi:hypothetical protein
MLHFRAQEVGSSERGARCLRLVPLGYIFSLRRYNGDYLILPITVLFELYSHRVLLLVVENGGCDICYRFGIKR